jgi:predicted transcriptional regulator
MAFQMELNMGIPERAILSAIDELAEKTKFTYEDIAQTIPCSTPTVSRHMPKLLEAGKVVRTGQKRTGYRYQVVKEVIANDEL